MDGWTTSLSIKSLLSVHVGMWELCGLEKKYYIFEKCLTFFIIGSNTFSDIKISSYGMQIHLDISQLYLYGVNDNVDGTIECQEHMVYPSESLNPVRPFFDLSIMIHLEVQSIKYISIQYLEA